MAERGVGRQMRTKEDLVAEINKMLHVRAKFCRTMGISVASCALRCPVTFSVGHTARYITMNKDKLCVGARAAMGDHTCALLLRPVGEIPGGLWSWLVYVDGDVRARGPGSKRKDPIHWYATLLQGAHRLVVRDSKTNNPNCKESNTLHFTVGSQTEILVDVSFVNGEINLEFSSGAISHG